MNLSRFFAAITLLLGVGLSHDAIGKAPLTTIGNIGQFAVPLAAAVNTYYYRDLAGFKQLTATMIVTMGITYTLKYTINNRRPNGNYGSFPSGHTSSAFAGAGFINMRYGGDLSIPYYAAATVVGISRISAKYHWPLDVLGGVVLALGVNCLMTSKYPNHNFAWQIAVGEDDVVLSYSF